MQLSIVICTFNRCDYLADAIDSLMNLDCLDSIEHEMLIVDNCSTDKTVEIVEQRAQEAPIQYIHESTPGLSHARNRGLTEARGAFIAYLDDDILVTPGWMQALLHCFAETGAQVVGGRSLLQFEVSPPEWFHPEFRKMLSEVDLGDTRIEAADGRRLYGLNVAYDTQALRAAGGFDPSLGRHGKQLLSGEDLRANAAIVARGGRAFYEPEALVHHRIPAARMQWDYLLRLAASGARTRALLDKEHGIVRCGIGLAEAVVKASRASACALWPGPVATRRLHDLERYRQYCKIRAYLGRQE